MVNLKVLNEQFYVLIEIDDCMNYSNAIQGMLLFESCT